MRVNHATSIRFRWSLMAIVVLWACLAGPELWAAGSDLQKIHTGVRSKPHFTQLVFFVKGAHPSKLAPLSPEEFVIEFHELKTKLALEQVLQEPQSAVAGIRIIPTPSNTPQIRIRFRKPDSSVNHKLLPATPPRVGFYRLAVNVFPPSEPKPASPPLDAVTPPATTASPANPEEQVKKPEEGAKPAPQLTKAEEGLKANFSEPLQQANRSFDEGDYGQASVLYERFTNTAPTRKDELVAALYGLADSQFVLHEKNLADVGIEIIANYVQAITADPAAEQAPWAYFRCALAYEALGEYKKSAEHFALVLAKYPKHPATALCLIALGRKHQQEKSYVEAIKSFRSALDFPLEKSQRAMVQCYLGETLFMVGEHPQAIVMLQKSIEEDPTIYLHEPQILKYLGESFFIEKQYDKSSETIFWYLNLNPKAENRDLVLARIAEIFTLQDDKTMANKLYAYIQNTYPDSEGDVIAKIRRAEYLESKDRITQEEALAIYRELLQKPLPAPLSRLVHFKFALRQFERGDFEQCLKIIDGCLQDIPNKISFDDLLNLRSKAVLEWAKQAFGNQDYARAVQLYERNTRIFAAANSPDLDHMIAESYGRLKLYGTAIGLYQQILNKKGIKTDEELLLKLADYSCQAGDLDRATEFCVLVQAPALQPDKLITMARIYFARRHYAKVIDSLNALPEKDKNSQNSDWQAIYGESLLQLGEFEKAIPWLDKALERIKGDSSQVEERVRLCVSTSTCYSNLNNYEKAIAVLEEAASLTESEDTRNRLIYDSVKLYLALGQTEKASQKLTKLLESSRTFWQLAARQQLDYIQLQGK
jgi:tetratricopeptide (TPR) repeat protein